MRAIIFDMDGVISDTQKLHAEIEQKLLRKHGINLSINEISKQYAGVPGKVMFTDLFKKYNIKANISLVLAEKQKEFEKRIEEGVKEIKGVISVISELKWKKIPMAIASTSSKYIVNRVLEQLEIKDNFTVIVAGDQIKKGKPDPEIFFTVAEGLELPPENCIVIEDGASGIKGAKRAGMVTIGFGEDVKDKGNFSAKDMEELNKILNQIF